MKEIRDAYKGTINLIFSKEMVFSILFCLFVFGVCGIFNGFTDRFDSFLNIFIFIISFIYIVGTSLFLVKVFIYNPIKYVINKIFK